MMVQANGVVVENVPRVPKPGMRVFVSIGTSKVLGTHYRVQSVNSRSFYVSGSGKTQRFLLSEWGHWLTGLLPTGRVFVDDVQITPVAPPEQTDRVRVSVSVRDARFLRAATQVLKRYQIRREDSGGVVTGHMSGGAQPYQVRVQRDWSALPHCSCPDAARTETGGFCKHVVAFLLREDDLRFQLLDALI